MLDNVTGLGGSLYGMAHAASSIGVSSAVAYLATFSTVPPSETAAVKALWGEIAIGGRMPVSIPGLAAYGDGLRTAAVRAPQEREQ